MIRDAVTRVDNPYLIASPEISRDHVLSRLFAFGALLLLIFRPRGLLPERWPELEVGQCDSQVG